MSEEMLLGQQEREYMTFKKWRRIKFFEFYTVIILYNNSIFEIGI